MPKSVVISVSTTAERDIIIRNIYDQLINDVDPSCTVQKDRVNRIRIHYNEGLADDSPRSLVCTYIVVILPVIFSLAPLEGVTGRVNFHLDTTIKKLTELLNELNSLQGERLIEENTDVSTFDNLVRCLT